MTPADRRFMQSWEDQKKGSRFGYYLTYTLGWSVVSFFVIFFLTKLFTNLWETGGKNLIYLYIGISVVAAILATHLTWTANEKRLHRLTREQQEKLN